MKTLKNKKIINKEEELLNHLIYGDIDEVDLSILGNDRPKGEKFLKLDDEQYTRLCAAATVKAYFENKLHRGGYLIKK